MGLAGLQGMIRTGTPYSEEAKKESHMQYSCHAPTFWGRDFVPDCIVRVINNIMPGRQSQGLVQQRLNALRMIEKVVFIR